MPIETRTIARGNKFTIDEIVKNGKSYVESFIKRLERKQVAGIVQLIEYVADNGPPLNKEKFRSEGDGIFALKHKQIRIYCFYAKNKLILLTNGAIKKQRKANPGDLDRAKAMRDEYMKERG